ncbi:hypothetical protein MY10362_000585 [Beauveria mimosiformis]
MVLAKNSAKISDDLSDYIDIKVNNIRDMVGKSYPGVLKNNVRSALKNRAGGTLLWTSLMLAELQAGKGQEVMVKFLLDNSAHIDAKDEDNRTPLSRATKEGHEDVAKLLLNNGANADLIRDYTGLVTPALMPPTVMVGDRDPTQLREATKPSYVVF